MFLKITLIVGAFVILAYAVILWVNGIDYMKENHPDYKGEDFLN
jgi:hypothetical protein